MNKRRGQAGVTLLELIIAIVIIGILMASAVPSFMDLIDHNRVRGAAEGLFADLQYAKSEAIKRSTAVSVVVTAGTPWTYCVSLTTDCATASNVLKSVSGSDFANTTLNANATVTFDFLRGTATLNPTTIATTTPVKFTGSSGTAGSVTVSAMGQIRVSISW